MLCRLGYGAQLSDRFDIGIGDQQGCLLSPFPFISIIDWIMRTSTEGGTNRLQWTLWTQFDDPALLSHNHAQKQSKTTFLATTSAQTGVIINKGKTKIMRIQHTSNSPVTVAGQPLEEVDSFTYLESVVDTQGGTDADVRAREGKARTTFTSLWFRNIGNDKSNTP